MTRNVQSVKPSTNINVAQDLMETDLVGGLPVVSSGKLVGIVTRTDILKLEPSKRGEKTVADVMAMHNNPRISRGRPVFSVDENDDERSWQTSSRFA